MSDRTIIVRLEGGVAQSVRATDAALAGIEVIIVNDGHGDASLVTKLDAIAEHVQAIRQARDRTACHGLGTACELASEWLLALSKQSRVDAVSYRAQIDAAVGELAAMLDEAMRRT